MPELPEELVEKAENALEAMLDASGGAASTRDLSRRSLEAVLPSILRERNEYQDDAAYAHAEWRKETCRLEAAEGQRDAERERADKHRAESFAYAGQVLALRGERDRLREAATESLDLIVGAWVLSSWQQIAERHEKATALLRAALSTGDRQNDDSHVRTAEATQPGIAGHDDAGGEAG